MSNCNFSHRGENSERYMFMESQNLSTHIQEKMFDDADEGTNPSYKHNMSTYNYKTQ